MNDRFLSDRTPHSLTRRILRIIDECGLVAGQSLPSEASLCATLQASRPAVREALRALETLGVVVARKGSGRILQPFTFNAVLGEIGQKLALGQNRLLDMLAIRQTLEFNFLPVAAPHISPAAYAEMDGLVAAMQAKATAGEVFSAEDRRFHALLYTGLGNEVLLGLLSLFWEMFEAVDPRGLMHQEQAEVTAGHHRKILQSLQSGDVRQAQFHLDTHFYDVVWSLSRALEKPP